MGSLLVKAATAGLVSQVATYAVAFAAVTRHYVATTRRNAGLVSARGFIRHLLPRHLLVSRWTRLDLALYGLTKLMAAFVYPSVGAMVALVAMAVQWSLNHGLGTGPAIPLNALTLVAFLLCGLLTRDFAAFYVHYLQHRVLVLWEFHKVHHAPETLVPLTTYRLHPFDQLLGFAAEALLFGLVAGTFAWLTHQTAAQLIVPAIGLYTLVNVLTFAPLRHSHIDFRLGGVERVLLSPAHHQLHHSREPEHWDKNFGTLFPFWDRCFGTLHAPPLAEAYRLGLSGDESAKYSTVLACYLEPFRAIQRATQSRGLWSVMRPAGVRGRKPRQRPPALRGRSQPGK